MGDLDVKVNVHLWGVSIDEILRLSPNVYLLGGLPLLGNSAFRGRETRYDGRRIISVSQENEGSREIIYRISDKGTVKGMQGEQNVGCGKYSQEKIEALKNGNSKPSS